MLARKLRSAFWLWLKISLAVFLLLLAGSAILPPLLTILRVPSFAVGNGMGWVLRWENEPGVRFAVSFNPFALLAIAAVIALVSVLLWANRQRRHQKQANRRQQITEKSHTSGVNRRRR